MNDERPIEKLLRRYAQKRRDEAGDPPVLHPATRRLLQSEVARQFPKPAAESKASGTNFFALLTGRWIYAVSVLVVLGVAAALLLPSLNKSKSGAFLAQNEAAEETAVRESLAPMTAPPAEVQPTLVVAEDRRIQPALGPSGGGNYSRLRDESAALSYTVTNGAAVGSLARFADDKRDADALRKAEETKQVSLSMSLDSAAPKSRAVSVQSPARSADESVSADSPGLAGVARAGRDDTTDRFNESRQAAPPPAAAAAPAPSTVLSDKTFVARGGGVEKDAARSYSQSFANVAPEQLKAKAANVRAITPVTPVLANFQVQNVGNQLRVIDSDGSTYLGEVSAAADGQAAVANFESANLRRAQTLAEAAVANQQATQYYLWRVEGTNRTLNQNVVFTWNFVETVSNSLAASQLNASSTVLNQNTATSPSQFPSLLNNSTINGRAQIGPAQQIEVNAVPLKQ